MESMDVRDKMTHLLVQSPQGKVAWLGAHKGRIVQAGRSHGAFGNAHAVPGLDPRILQATQASEAGLNSFVAARCMLFGSSYCVRKHDGGITRHDALILLVTSQSSWQCACQRLTPVSCRQHRHLRPQLHGSQGFSELMLCPRSEANAAPRLRLLQACTVLTTFQILAGLMLHVSTPKATQAR